MQVEHTMYRKLWRVNLLDFFTYPLEIAQESTQKSDLYMPL
jgi:hypothetical protein